MKKKWLLPRNNCSVYILYFYFYFLLYNEYYLFDYDFLYSDLNQINLTVLLVISIYAIYGLVDDLVDLGHKLKFLLPITFSSPLISVINPETFPIPFYEYLDLNDIILHNIEYGDLLRIIIIPLYVMVVANLVNMHSGYSLAFSRVYP